jgi:hypothetical protein
MKRDGSLVARDDASSGHAPIWLGDTPERRATVEFVIPRPLKVEHEELDDKLRRATKEAGALGEAARAVAKVMHPHFLKERRTRFHRWTFQERYREELSSRQQRARTRLILEAAGKGPLTLVYGAKDPEHNQAAVLRDALSRMSTRDLEASGCRLSALAGSSHRARAANAHRKRPPASRRQPKSLPSAPARSRPASAPRRCARGYSTGTG